jgi:transcriptional regulator with XRE-family HTH domain
VNNSIDLSHWIKKQIGDEKPYSSLNEMAKELGISQTTLRRLRDGNSANSKTISKLSLALHMSTADFLKMIEDMENDPEVHREIEHRIVSGIDRLTDDEQRILWNLMQSFLEGKER